MRIQSLSVLISFLQVHEVFQPHAQPRDCVIFTYKVEVIIVLSGTSVERRAEQKAGTYAYGITSMILFNPIVRDNSSTSVLCSFPSLAFFFPLGRESSGT